LLSYTHSYAHPHIHTHTHKHRHTHRCPNTSTHAYAHVHKRTRTETHRRTHRCSHTHTQRKVQPQTLQLTATHCSTLQHTATHYNTKLGTPIESHNLFGLCVHTNKLCHTYECTHSDECVSSCANRSCPMWMRNITSYLWLINVWWHTPTECNHIGECVSCLWLSRVTCKWGLLHCIFDPFTCDDPHSSLHSSQGVCVIARS